MKRQSRLSLTLGGAILVGGFIGMVVLFQFREPPAEASTGIEDRRLEVQVAIAEPDTHGVEIEGFGTARAAKSVNMSPEVSGRVVYASPALRVGAHVEQGELLLRIDSARYESMVAERDAEIGRIEAEIERLKATAESDQGRVAVMERSRELARAQFERARVLLEEHVGNQLDVDRSEQSYNDATDRLRQLQTVLNTYPMAIREAEKRLAAAKSALERAHLDLARTELYAPFAGRIDAVLIEALGAGDAGAPSIAAGHYAEAGRPLFVLADDTRMEVPIKLDARDVHQWLRRTETANGSELVAVECVVAWTEIDPAPEWSGTLDRIEDYTSATRTVTAVVSVDLALQNTRTVPLAAGMFCSVRLPGNAIDGVFAVPQSAVSVDGTVYLAIDERLVSRPVHVARAEGGTAYVDSGIEAGDLIVTTRLVNPIEGTLLRVAKNGMAGTE